MPLPPLLSDALSLSNMKGSHGGLELAGTLSKASKDYADVDVQRQVNASTHHLTATSDQAISMQCAADNEILCETRTIW